MDTEPDLEVRQNLAATIVEATGMAGETVRQMEGIAKTMRVKENWQMRSMGQLGECA